MRLRRIFHRAQASRPYASQLLTLCAFFAVGIVSGQVVQSVVADAALTAYLQDYVGAMTQAGLPGVSLWRAAALCFREPLAVCLLGFCTFGAIVIPPVCAWQGFTLSFAVSCLADSFGSNGLLLSLALFCVRSLIVLPCTLVLAQWAFDRTLCRLRGEAVSHGGGQRMQLLKCWLLLLLGAVLETAIVPELVTLVLNRIS